MIDAKKRIKTEPKKEQSNEKKSEIVARFRSGCISATIFKQEVKTEDRTYDAYSFNIQRSYKDKEDNWQHTNSMRKQDIQGLSVVLNSVATFMLLDESTTEETE